MKASELRSKSEKELQNEEIATLKEIFNLNDLMISLKFK